MKPFFFLFVIFAFFLNFHSAFKKFRKHSAYIDNGEIGNNSLKIEQIFNQTEHKLFNQLLLNFKENEQMSEILSMFKKIKAEVTNFDENLSNYSKKVLALNQEILNYYSLNQYDSNNKEVIKLQLNRNLTILRKIKKNFTLILSEIQGVLLIFSENFPKNEIFTLKGNKEKNDNFSYYNESGNQTNNSNFSSFLIESNSSSFKEINNNTFINENSTSFDNNSNKSEVSNETQGGLAK